MRFFSNINTDSSTATIYIYTERRITITHTYFILRITYADDEIHSFVEPLVDGLGNRLDSEC